MLFMSLSIGILCHVWYLIVLIPDLCTLTYFVFVMLSCLFIAALWSPEGKGLTSWLLFMMSIVIFFTFPFGILEQVWFLIISIPDPYCLSYFYLT